MRFDLKTFIRTLLIFLVLSAIWTYFSVSTDRFTNNDKGFLTGVGYLILLAASFHFGRSPFAWDKWVLLTICVVGIFSVASFVLYWLSAIHEVLYFVVNAIFVSWAMTAVLKRFYGLEKRREVMVVTAVLLLASYGLIYGLKYSVPDYLGGIHGMFNIFQLALVIPLAVGLSIRRKVVPVES